MIKVAVLGYGTVGSGVVEVLEKNRQQVAGKAGQELQVAYILDLRDFPEDPYADKVIHDFQVILQDAEVDIVCEVMGGVGPAYQFTKQALEAGKSVCTSNKELVARHGAELLEIAMAHGCSYLFEASVGGGIPLIRPICNALTAEKLLSVTGILNGTTNYILTRMDREGADYGQVLNKAQELGYAERNPEADVEGHDACRKIAILSSLLTGKNVDPKGIYTEGITGITSADFAYARAAGCSIKLLAASHIQEDGSVCAWVAPFLVEMAHPLAAVNDVFNGVLVNGNMVGEVMFYGPGAGKLPTASAVVADVIDCARNGNRTISCGWSEEPARMSSFQKISHVFFVRASEKAREEVLAAFPVQKCVDVAERTEDFGFLTQPMEEGVFAQQYEKLGDKVLGRIRCLGVQ